VSGDRVVVTLDHRRRDGNLHLGFEDAEGDQTLGFVTER
jgi:hypothetical protein